MRAGSARQSMATSSCPGWISMARNYRHAPGQRGACRFMFADQRGNLGRRSMRDIGFGRSGDRVAVASSVEPLTLRQPRRRDMLRDAANAGAGDHARQRDEKNRSRNRARDARSIRGHSRMIPDPLLLRVVATAKQDRRMHIGPLRDGNTPVRNPSADPGNKVHLRYSDGVLQVSLRASVHAS